MKNSCHALDPEEIIIEGDNPTDPPAWIVADLTDLNADSTSNTQPNETIATNELQISNNDDQQTDP